MNSYKEMIGKKEKDPSNRTFAVIVKNRIDCNYNCTYCYTEGTNEHKSMSIDIAKIMIEKISEYVGNKTLYFVWHGGEPLLSGLDFFYGVYEITKKHKNSSIINGIQTNAAFIDKDFIKFCKDTGFKISTSLDGPKDINDITRKDLNKNGTFDRTMEAIKTLKNEGIDISCVSVLHKNNVTSIDEMYNFFKKEKINFRINPVVKAGNAVNNYNSLAISPKEYGRAMCRLFDLWFYDDDKEILVDPLLTIVGNILEDQVWGCNFQGRCLQGIISITPDGNIYPCGRFIGNTEFELGNILECDSLSDVFDSTLFRDLSRRDASTIPGCKNCDYAEICNGGCMITAHMAKSNIYDSDYYCAGRKMLFGHILKTLKKENIDLNNQKRAAHA
jgi:uncharacterized protein